jgi:hypothetical protein
MGKLRKRERILKTGKWVVCCLLSNQCFPAQTKYAAAAIEHYANACTHGQNVTMVGLTIAKIRKFKMILMKRKA